MRRLLLASLLAFAFASTSNAAPCAMSSLSAYVSLGAGGCTIGAYTVSGFLATVVLPPPDADPIDPDTVTVTPVPGVGLDFGLDAFTDAGQLDLLIRFALAGPLLGAAQLSLANTTAIGDGSVSAIQDTCVGGTFQSVDPTAPCSGTPSTLIALQTETDFISPVSDTFAAHSFFDVFVEITLDAGQSGAASAGTVSTRFGAVSIPEPSIVILLTAALAAACRRRPRL